MIFFRVWVVHEKLNLYWWCSDFRLTYPHLTYDYPHIPAGACSRPFDCWIARKTMEMVEFHLRYVGKGFDIGMGRWLLVGVTPLESLEGPEATKLVLEPKSPLQSLKGKLTHYCMRFWQRRFASLLWWLGDKDMNVGCGSIYKNNTTIESLWNFQHCIMISLGGRTTACQVLKFHSAMDLMRQQVQAKGDAMVPVMPSESETISISIWCLGILPPESDRLLGQIWLLPSQRWGPLGTF